MLEINLTTEGCCRHSTVAKMNLTMGEDGHQRSTVGQVTRKTCQKNQQPAVRASPRFQSKLLHVSDPATAVLQPGGQHDAVQSSRVQPRRALLWLPPLQPRPRPCPCPPASVHLLPGPQGRGCLERPPGHHGVQKVQSCAQREL